MIPHGEAVRNAVRVEWMRLEYFGDMLNASRWLDAHGVENIIRRYDNSLTIYGPQGATDIAHLGDWLTHCPSTGEIRVCTNERFHEEHGEVVGVLR